MAANSPQNVYAAIAREEGYDALYDPKEVKREGELLNKETTQLIVGIVLADQEDRDLLGKTTK